MTGNPLHVTVERHFLWRNLDQFQTQKSIKKDKFPYYMMDVTGIMLALWEDNEEDYSRAEKEKLLIRIHPIEKAMRTLSDRIQGTRSCII